MSELTAEKDQQPTTDAGKRLAAYAMLGAALETEALDPPDCLRCGMRIDIYNRSCCHTEDCHGCSTDPLCADPCVHSWVTRPESDTTYCEICGVEA